jgi:amino-acid N-acetyltransferase
MSPDTATAIIRPARVADAERILSMINDYASKQIMLPRSPMSVYEGIRDFIVADADGKVVGCGALHVVWGDLAEIRSLAVDPAWTKRGLGNQITQRLIDDADGLGIARLFAFTYVPGFFAKMGFRGAEHSELPHKVFGDCMNCPKFSACDEVAVIRDLRPMKEYAQGPLSRPLPKGPLPRLV